MATKPSSHVSVVQISKLASASTYAEGLKLFAAGAVTALKQAKGTVKAQVDDSDGGVFAPRARLSADGVEDVTCDCANVESGLCAHLVALLVTVSGAPLPGKAPAARQGAKTPVAAGTRASSLRSQLTKRSQPELVDLILSLAERDTKLRPEIEILLRGGLAEKDIKAVRDAITKLMQRYDRRRDMTSAAVVRELRVHFKRAEAAVKDTPQEALTLYLVIATTLLKEGREAFVLDEDERIWDAFDRSLAAVDSTWQHATAELHQQVVTLFWDAFIMEAPMPMELECEPNEILARLSDEDWQAIDGKIQGVLNEVRPIAESRPANSHDARWQKASVLHAAMVQLRALRIGLTSTEAAADAHIFENGLPADKLMLLMARNRYVEAVAMARKCHRLPTDFSMYLTRQLLVTGEIELARGWAKETGVGRYFPELQAPPPQGIIRVRNPIQIAEASVGRAKNGPSPTPESLWGEFVAAGTMKSWNKLMASLPESDRQGWRDRLKAFAEEHNRPDFLLPLQLESKDYESALTNVRTMKADARSPLAFEIATICLPTELDFARRAMRIVAECSGHPGVTFEVYAASLADLKAKLVAAGQSKQWREILFFLQRKALASDGYKQLTRYLSH